MDILPSYNFRNSAWYVSLSQCRYGHYSVLTYGAVQRNRLAFGFMQDYRGDIAVSPT